MVALPVVALPAGFTTRPPTHADRAAIVDLLVACDTVDVGEPDYSLDDLETDWKEPGFDPATDALLVHAPDGELVGYVMTSPVDGGAKVILDSYASPPHRHLPLDPWLIDWGIARGREIATRCGTTRLISHSVSTEDRIDRLQERGFVLLRNFHRMTIDLGGAIQKRTAEGITVRPATAEDTHDVHAAIEEAFADHWDHEPEPYEQFAIRAVERASFDPSMWRVALDGDRVVGALVARDDGDGVGWIARLGVRREARGRGVGAAMLTTAFEDFRSRGLTRATLGVDSDSLTGATRLYESVGMRVQVVICAMQLDLSHPAV